MLRSLIALAVVAFAILAIGGGPIVFVLLLMIGAPFALFFAIAACGHESREHPHFASPPSRR